MTIFSSVNIKPNPPQLNASEIMPQISEKRRLLEQLHAHREATCEVWSFNRNTRFKMDLDQEDALDLVLEVDGTENEAEADSDDGFGSDDVNSEMDFGFSSTNYLSTTTKSESTHITKQYNDMISCLESQRYWMPRSRTVKATTIEQWFHQPMFDKPHIFRSTFRMDRSSFDLLVKAIHQHLVFSNQSNCNQKPVQYQLAVFLYRLGGRSGGGTQMQSGLALGVGEGTIPLYFGRVMTAILSMKKTYIRWPGVEERNAHKQRVCAASLGVFPGCVGFVDGTFITLQYAPLTDWYCYFNRKGSYALNAMVVCNDPGRITYMRVGDTSAVHDTRIFDNSQLALHPQNFFSEDEFLIGDSAYTCNKQMITPFKKPRAKNIDCRLFNATLSSR